MMGPLIQKLYVKVTFHVILCICLAHAEFNLVVPSDPVIGSVGHDIILPCHLSPKASAVAMGIRWFKDGNFADYLYLYQDGKGSDGKGYEGRVSLFTQQLEKGNVSLLLKNLGISDGGRYKCQATLREWIREQAVDLQITQQGSVPRISLGKHQRTSIELSCRSDSWSPEPHMIWIDRSQGEMTSAKTEKHQKLQGGILYSIVSHVSVEINQLDEITCVVMSQDRKYKLESAIQITEEFYKGSVFDRAYVSAFVIPIFLGMVSITASVLYAQHQRKGVQKKLQPITDLKKEVEEMKKQVEETKKDLDEEKHLMGIVGEIPETVWTLMLYHADSITLDPDTAHPRLTLSEDRTSVAFGEKYIVKSNTERRFEEKNCVLGKDGYASGKHYWVIDLGEKIQWRVGVAQEPENTQSSNIQMYPEHGYWSICFENGQLKTVEQPSLILPIQLKPVKLGVFVDYEEGRIAFFDVEKRRHIHSFPGTFTKKLYPFIGPLYTCKIELKISLVKREAYLAA